MLFTRIGGEGFLQLSRMAQDNELSSQVEHRLSLDFFQVTLSSVAGLVELVIALITGSVGLIGRRADRRRARRCPASPSPHEPCLPQP
ncbi:MAG: hypothetical protein LC749_05865 [Actinobacteria bacterium]|nr:hypothetical protein [Actinomycetota bacterium]